tara:strand:- start:618 stop:1808 length:1191 start_codon:yes stop_codon:yes gene_type:complete
MYFEGRRDKAFKLLEVFLKKKIEKYDSQRNFDYGKGDYRFVSTLSPYISHGVITEKEILKKVILSPNYSHKFIQEVFWRVYWKGWLENRNIVWKNFIKFIEKFNRDKFPDKYLYNNALTGNTNIDPYNKWVTDLIETGYLHNHTRMWFASIWIHYMGLPWQLGAKFFLENLLDADPASNTLSWRWVAGLQTKGKKYIATEKNINIFTNQKFQGFTLPKMKDIILEDEVLNDNTMTYKSNIHFKTDSALFIFENNIYPELLYDKINTFKCVFLIRFKVNNFKLSNNVLHFKDNLIKDFIKNVKEKGTKINFIFLPEDERKIIKILKENRIRNIVHSYLTVGNEKDIFNGFKEKSLQLLNIQEVLDSFFVEAWRYSKKGFFKFKKEIPLLIDKFIKNN